MRALRTIMIILILLSLLLIPYSLIAYACYLGICGGQPASEIGAKYTRFYGYFSWIYLIVVIVSLYTSRLFKKKNQLKNSIYCLLIPFIALIPFIYVEWGAGVIQGKYTAQHREYNTPHPADYVCSPGKFIRSNKDYLYFDFDIKGDSGSMTAYQNYDELKKALAEKSIDISACKNQNDEHL
jgi:hypothetical protein